MGDEGNFWLLVRPRCLCFLDRRIWPMQRSSPDLLCSCHTDKHSLSSPSRLQFLCRFSSSEVIRLRILCSDWITVSKVSKLGSRFVLVESKKIGSSEFTQGCGSKLWKKRKWWWCSITFLPNMLVPAQRQSFKFEESNFDLSISSLKIRSIKGCFGSQVSWT